MTFAVGPNLLVSIDITFCACTLTRPQIAPWTHTYDATFTLRGYRTMPLWPAYRFHDGDLVLMDVHVIRRKCDNTGRLRRTGGWDFFRVERELRAVSMIRPSVASTLQTDPDEL